MNATTETQSAETTGRYQVGETVYGISFIATDSNGNKDTRKTFFAGMFTQGLLTEFRFQAFKVAEHHKVAWDQDPKEEKKHDGYVLHSSDGRVFLNQYPKASYGQMSDTADRVFRLDLRGMDMDAIDALIKNETQVPIDWINVTDPLDELYRGVHDAAFQLRNGEMHNQYVALLDTIVKEFEKAYPGKTIDFQPPWEQAPDVKVSVVVDKL